MHCPDLTDAVAADMTSTPEMAISFIRKERSAAKGTESPLYCFDISHFYCSFLSVDTENVAGIDKGQGSFHEQASLHAFFQFFQIAAVLAAVSELPNHKFLRTF